MCFQLDKPKCQIYGALLANARFSLGIWRSLIPCMAFLYTKIMFQHISVGVKKRIFLEKLGGSLVGAKLSRDNVL